MNEQGKAVSNKETEALRRIEILIGRVLFWGALLSIILATAGLVIYIVQGGLTAGTLNLQEQLRHQNKSEAPIFTSVSEVVTSLVNFSNPLAITGVGLVLLLLIPVIAVTLLIPAFLREKDYRFATIASIVLVILFVGLAVGGE